MNRNLDGIYFRVKRGEKLENGDFVFTYEDAEIRHEDMGVAIFTSREDAEKALEGSGEK